MPPQRQAERGGAAGGSRRGTRALFKFPVDVITVEADGITLAEPISPNQVRWAFCSTLIGDGARILTLGVRAGHWASRNLRQTPPGLAIDFPDLSPEVVLLLTGELIPRLCKTLSQHQ
jgi:hypothetical protein